MVQTFRVFCGTYNVNGQSPNRDVRDWLVPPDSTDTEPPDLYAVGFQVNIFVFMLLPCHESKKYFQEVRVRDKDLFDSSF